MNASNIFKKNFSIKNLKKIYFDKIEGSGAIGLDRIKPANLKENLSSEVSLIYNKYYNDNYNFTAYKEKLISKGAKSCPRQISIPTARDRITLRAICDSLAEIFPDAKLSLPQEVIHSLNEALNSGKYKEYIKIDLKGFYPSIPHELIENSLKQKIRKKEIKNIIRKAIRTPTVNNNVGRNGAEDNVCGVPQGLSISNILAEISLSDIDMGISLIPDIWYKRYVDDILILTKSGKANEIAGSVINRLKSIGLDPHPLNEKDSKSVVSTFVNSFSFLGYYINSNHILIKKESISRFESSIAKILTAYKYNIRKSRTSIDKDRALAYCKWKLNLRITGCIFDGKRYGWVAYFSQISSTYQLRSLNHVINKMLQRFDLKKEIKQKSLIKTFYELHRGNKEGYKYIPNFDNLTISQQRDIVKLWLGTERTNKLSNTKIVEMFKQKISVSIKELEEDISGIS